MRRPLAVFGLAYFLAMLAATRLPATWLLPVVIAVAVLFGLALVFLRKRAHGLAPLLLAACLAAGLLRLGYDAVFVQPMALLDDTRQTATARVVAVEPGYVLALGCGGERILYHPDAQTLPKKHQLLLRFADDTYLTVSVQGWGAAQLVPREDLGARTYVDPGRVSPLGGAFTWEHYDGLFQDLEPKDSRSIKFFCISKPGIWGLGNGYLQDILYQAHVHPRRKAADLTPDERRALFDATVDVLRRATDLGGRDTERDLHNRPGGYRPALDRRMVGEPCPGCGTPIAKIQFQGGSCYFCPDCQPL